MKSLFKIGDRVRIKFGVNRGKYAEVTHVGGDDGTYYGIRIEGEPDGRRDIGYSEYELEKGIAWTFQP